MDALPYTNLTSDNWDHYMQYRPRYPPKTWTSFLAYHRGPLTTIHELGCGSGVGAQGLLTTTNPTITHLILSDPGPTNIAAARALLTPLLLLLSPTINVSFHTGPAEEGLPPSLAAPGTIDLVFACECLHWTEIRRTLTAAAAQLRPGGTFASVYYMHIPRIRNSPIAEVAFDNFALACWRKKREDGPGGKQPSAQAGLGLDFVPFDQPPGAWTDVKRVYMNFKQGQRWTRPKVLDVMMAGVKMESAVREGEEEEAEWVEVDEGWQRKGCKAEWFRGFLRTLQFMFPDDLAFDTEEWAAFEVALQEVGGAVDVYWPASMIMARKK